MPNISLNLLTHFIQSHHTQQLITLTISVIEGKLFAVLNLPANCLVES